MWHFAQNWFHIVPTISRWPPGCFSTRVALKICSQAKGKNTSWKLCRVYRWYRILEFMVMNDGNTLQKYCSKVSIDQMFSVGVWGKYLSFEEETALLIKALKKSVIFTVSLCNVAKIGYWPFGWARAHATPISILHVVYCVLHILTIELAHNFLQLYVFFVCFYHFLMIFL